MNKKTLFLLSCCMALTFSGNVGFAATPSPSSTTIEIQKPEIMTEISKTKEEFERRKNEIIANSNYDLEALKQSSAKEKEKFDASWRKQQADFQKDFDKVSQQSTPSNIPSSFSMPESNTSSFDLSVPESLQSNSLNPSFNKQTSSGNSSVGQLVLDDSDKQRLDNYYNQSNVEGKFTQPNVESNTSKTSSITSISPSAMKDSQLYLAIFGGLVFIVMAVLFVVDKEKNKKI